MSNIHEGVSCDMCMKSNFTGKRYKCLICYDYDLCASCHEKFTSGQISSKTTSATTAATVQKALTTGVVSATNENHAETHPMQCILTKSDYELYYGTSSGLIDYGEHLSFTCPYCGKLGFSETTLCDHITVSHLNNQQPDAAPLPQEVVCPICAVLPSSSGGDPNHLTEDLLHHISLEHVNNRSLGVDSDPFTCGFGSSTGGSTGAAARFSRRLNYAANASRAAAASSGVTTGSTHMSNLLSRNHPSSNRFAFQFSNPGSTASSGLGALGAGGLSSFIRSATSAMETFGGGGSTTNTTATTTGSANSTGGSAAAAAAAAAAAVAAANAASDPIVELLSQLTGARRGNSSNLQHLQLQQLQAQLNRDRESLQQSAVAALSSSSRSAAATGGNHQQYTHHLFSNVASSSSAGSSNPLANKLLSSKISSNAAAAAAAAAAINSQNPNNSNGNLQNSSANSQVFVNQILELPNNIFLQPLPVNTRDPRFLLTKYDFNNFETQSPTAQPAPGQTNQSQSQQSTPVQSSTGSSSNQQTQQQQQNTNKTNLLNQSMFLNELLLSLFLHQSTSSETGGASASAAASSSSQQQSHSTENNELILEDLLNEQQRMSAQTPTGQTPVVTTTNI